jgi:Zn-dependent peptidase ImmA (M78 family)
VNIGDAKELNFSLEWSGDGGALAQGALRVRFGDTNIWADDAGNGIRWTWIELLEQLARSWPFLLNEELVPEEIGAGIFDVLRTGLLQADEFGSGEISRSAYVFNRRHNLATGIEGLFLPSFSILREGRKVWIGSRSVLRLVDFEPTIDTLAQLGNAICERVSEANDERAVAAVSAWQHREPPFSTSILLKLGFQDLSHLVATGQDASDFFEVNEEHSESSLLVFARMSTPVPIDVQKRLIGLIRMQAKRSTSRLDQLSQRAELELPFFNRRAFEQGYALAIWARRELGIAPDAKADPSTVLQSLNVECMSYELGIDTIDAVGCWDAKHGPVILVNRDGRHAHSRVGRRATLAHELAHLIIDRHGSLPVAEVFGGNAPVFPEQRAKAFAAEFLLPHSVIGERIMNSTDSRGSLQALIDTYDVSRELAGWHISNSRHFPLLSVSDQAFIRAWTRGEEGSVSWNA